MTTPVPTCNCHACRYEKPALESRVSELQQELAAAQESSETLRINARTMHDALELISRGYMAAQVAQQAAEDALAALLTVDEVTT